jgi:phosphinothricin acetyltransferase
VAEVSIYIAAAMRGQGIGGALLETLIRESEEKGFWTLQAGIFPENEASMALHQKYGFRIVGRRDRLGKMDDRWRDVMLLERRSAVAGK